MVRTTHPDEIMPRSSPLPPAPVLAAALLLSLPAAGRAATVNGELLQWHEVELRFTGPTHAENDSSPNPFLDYRLQCRFTGPSSQVYDVPGFFDTNAAGGTTGNTWICRFAPDEAGTWSYIASFRTGSEVAISLATSPGSATSFDGDAGNFVVGASDKTGRDFRAPGHGTLRAEGGHYLVFGGSGTPWIKGGPDIPENFLGYVGIDNTPDAGHAFAAHENDWNNGDPDWNDGDGRAIIGALNYIAERGANSIYFLPMNIGGDGKDTFPTRTTTDKLHFDTSKLRQWNTIFTHADRLGIFLHFQLSETETANENYHDNGNLGPERKLFYRELIARFGHHLGLEWDLGEENDYGTAKHEAFAAYLKAVDPYDHPVTTHTKSNQFNTYYDPLLGNPDFDMTAFQTSYNQDVLSDAVQEWRTLSAGAGEPLVVSIDEPQKIENDPDDEILGYPRGRREYLWPTYMAGGGGFEWYVQADGGGHSFDQSIEDFGDMKDALEWTGYALEFFGTLPVQDMAPVSGESDADYTLADIGRAYAMYNETGGAISLDLGSYGGENFRVTWFDPKTGKWRDEGLVTGGTTVDLGEPPFGGDVAVSVVNTASAVALPCPAAPRSDCKSSLRGKLQIKAGGTKRDKLQWQWKKGDELTLGELGDLASSTEHRLCIYDRDGGSPLLVAEIGVPFGRLWKTQKRGAKYTDKLAAFEGTKKLQFQTREAGKAKAQMQAKGLATPLPAPAGPDRYFDMSPSIDVQLVSSMGVCFATSFTSASKNEVDRFNAKLP